MPICFFFSNTLEDAQIAYRYSLRYAEGYDFGLWNRAGAPVEGFTSLLWMLLLSLFGPDLDAIVSASKYGGIIAHQTLILLLFSLWLRHANGKRLNIDLFSDRAGAAHAFLYAAISMALFLPISWYATSGMETVMFIMFIAMIFFLPLITGSLLLLSLIAIALILTRPDGIMFAFASPLYYWYVTKDRRWGLIAGIAILAFIALTLFRYGYFGHPMPNTYYAKSANTIGLLHIKHGVLYFASFIASYCYLFLPVPIACIAIIRRKGLIEQSFLPFAFVIIVLYYTIIAKAGADSIFAFPMWRHALHLFPLLLFCSFYALTQFKINRTKLFSKAIVGLLAVMPLTATTPQNNHRFLREQLHIGLRTFPNFNHTYKDNQLLLWLKKISSQDTVIATSLAGALPLTVDAYHIDLLGLNDEYIAHNGAFDPQGPIDSKTDMGYALSLRPDIIEGYISAQAIINHKKIEKAIVSWRNKMHRETFTNPIFKDEYLIIANAPYHDFDRVLYISKSYYKKIKERHAIETLPVDPLVKLIDR